MRKLLFILSLSCFAYDASAQSSGSASQRVQLQLNPIIEFSVVNNSGISVNNTGTEQLHVRSNSNFIINASRASINEAVTTDMVADGTYGSDKTFTLNNETASTKKLTNGNSGGMVYTATEP